MDVPLGGLHTPPATLEDRGVFAHQLGNREVVAGGDCEDDILGIKDVPDQSFDVTRGLRGFPGFTHHGLLTPIAGLTKATGT